MIDPKTSFCLAQAIEAEAERREQMVGFLRQEPYSYTLFLRRSKETRVPLAVLTDWHSRLAEGGPSALQPTDWQELSDEACQKMLARYNSLLPYAEFDAISTANIAALAESMDCSYRTAERWLDRFRIGGIYGLAPGCDPTKKSGDRRHVDIWPRDLGALSDAEIVEMYGRYERLGPFATRQSISEQEVNERAEKVGVSARTIRYDHAAYLRYGIKGLAPKPRADKGSYHGLSEGIIELTRGIRLSHPDLPVRRVLEAVVKKATELGEVPPSEYQVRRIIKEIPDPVKALADRREDDFRNRFGITYRIEHRGVVYQCDHCLIDVLVKDMRHSKIRSKSGEVRPWLSVIIDSRSRYVIAFIFSYDRPSRHTVASLIRKSVLAQPGGVPDMIYVDNGKDLIANHVRHVCHELGIALHICEPHQPQHRGILERFFGTVNTRLWSTLPGYVASNTVDRNPSVKADLTLIEVIVRFQKFLDEYHQEPHSSLGMSPLEFWTKNCIAFPPEDPRRLDLLLLEQSTAKVIKEGIKHHGRVYWHSELYALVGTSVVVRSDTRYEAPDEIEIFHDGQWICTAFARDSARGKQVSPEEVGEAKRRQRRHIRSQIDNARAAVPTTPSEESKPDPNPSGTAANESQSGDSSPQTSTEARPSAKKKKRTPKKSGDIFDRLPLDDNE